MLCSFFVLRPPIPSHISPLNPSLTWTTCPPKQRSWRSPLFKRVDRTCMPHCHYIMIVFLPDDQRLDIKYPLSFYRLITNAPLKTTIPQICAESQCFVLISVPQRIVNQIRSRARNRTIPELPQPSLSGVWMPFSVKEESYWHKPLFLTIEITIVPLVSCEPHSPFFDMSLILTDFKSDRRRSVTSIETLVGLWWSASLDQTWREISAVFSHWPDEWSLLGSNSSYEILHFEKNVIWQDQIYRKCHLVKVVTIEIDRRSSWRRVRGFCYFCLFWMRIRYKNA